MIRRLSIAVFVSCILALTLLFSSSLSEEGSNKKLVLLSTSFGTETIAHKNFTDKLLRNPKLNRNSTLKIFLGPYDSLMGLKGFIRTISPNYYIFIDAYFYYSITPEEKRALIAHEFGHAIYKYSFIDKLQLKILYEINYIDYFADWRSDIITKYQIRADEFSAENTSPEVTISFLNKLYNMRTENHDYKMRIENLNKLKQGKIP